MADGLDKHSGCDIFHSGGFKLDRGWDISCSRETVGVQLAEAIDIVRNFYTA